MRGSGERQLPVPTEPSWATARPDGSRTSRSGSNRADEPRSQAMSRRSEAGPVIHVSRGSDGSPCSTHRSTKPPPAQIQLSVEKVGSATSPGPSGRTADGDGAEPQDASTAERVATAAIVQTVGRFTASGYSQDGRLRRGARLTGHGLSHSARECHLTANRCSQYRSRPTAATTGLQLQRAGVRPLSHRCRNRVPCLPSDRLAG